MPACWWSSRHGSRGAGSSVESGSQTCTTQETMRRNDGRTQHDTASVTVAGPEDLFVRSAHGKTCICVPYLPYRGEVSGGQDVI